MNVIDLKDLDDEMRKKIEELLKITSEKDGFKLFLAAQVTLGKLLLDNSLHEGAIKIYSEIQRSDDPSLYAAAQYTIGEIIETEGNREGALTYFKNIKHSDDPKIYAAAQYYIGFILSESSDIEGAISAWSVINRSDNISAYIEAQFDIGFYLAETGYIKEALSAWRNISRLDDPELYCRAQFNIGSNLFKINKVDDALLAWRNIDKLDSSEAYAKAQLRIGSALIEDEDYEGGLLAWCNVKRPDDLETYAKAQFKIANFLIGFKYHKAAVVELQLIELMDDVEAYAKAQFNIGVLLGKNSDVDGALKAFRNIEYKYDSEAYGKAQYAIGKILISDNYLTDYKSAKDSFELAREMFPYEARCYIRILELLDVPETKSLGLSSLNLLITVLNIVNILTLDFDNHADEEKPFERKLAHYTSTATANLLLEINGEKNLPSAFRLNTINNVNDPSEGQLLIRKLKGIKDNDFTALDFNEDIHAFISCFTFNHDSLNQFRLYGKQDNKEASGMSLVFRKEFFQSENFIRGLPYLSVDSAPKLINTLSDINHKKASDIKSEPSKGKVDSKKIKKKPVMRCIYLDPTSDYFHLAQRNRLTFFREFGENTIIKNGIEESQAEYEWSLYQKYMKKITSEFEIAFKSLKASYKEVETEIKNVRFNLGSLTQKELSALVDEVLLPLKYLIKHSAFREEQECRIIYITSTDRPEVTMEYGSFLYVEYEPSVKRHLDKIYIAPAALHHKRYFDYLLDDIDVPVEVSGNVFR